MTETGNSASWSGQTHLISALDGSGEALCLRALTMLCGSYRSRNFPMTVLTVLSPFRCGCFKKQTPFGSAVQSTPAVSLLQYQRIFFPVVQDDPDQDRSQWQYHWQAGRVHGKMMQADPCHDGEEDQCAQCPCFWKNHQ